METPSSSVPFHTCALLWYDTVEFIEEALYVDVKNLNQN